MSFRFNLLLICLLIMAFGCKNSKAKVQPEQEASQTVVDNKPSNPFVAKLINTIETADDRGYTGRESFVKNDWKLADRLNASDLKVLPQPFQEEHYVGKWRGRINPNYMAIDYYLFTDEQEAQQWLANYQQQWTWQADNEQQRGYNTQLMATDSICEVGAQASYIYHHANELALVRFSEDIHLVHKALHKFNEQEGIASNPDITAFLISNKLQQEIDALPLIDRKEANVLASKLKRWLSFNKVDIRKFQLLESSDWELSWEQEQDTTSLYYRTFEPKIDDVYFPEMHDYSPDRTMYVKLLESAVAYVENDTLKYFGGDDCQEIHLVSRKHKTDVMLEWLGVSSFMEECVWLDNSRFVLMGINGYSDYEQFVIYLYDVQNKKKMIYFYQDRNRLFEDNKIEEWYFTDYNLPNRGLPLLH